MFTFGFGARDFVGFVRSSVRSCECNLTSFSISSAWGLAEQCCVRELSQPVHRGLLFTIVCDAAQWSVLFAARVNDGARVAGRQVDFFSVLPVAEWFGSGAGQSGCSGEWIGATNRY